jgi:glutamate N-acetyltransferase/amino-acid N-acetyltransferase
MTEVLLQKFDEAKAVSGISLAACSTGAKYKGRNDLCLIEVCENASVAAVFTTNAFCAAPVVVAKEHLSKRNEKEKTYLLINAGNANAGTGQQGLKSAKECCQFVSSVFSIDDSQVLPFSTGVIGEQLKLDNILSGVAALKENGLSEKSWKESGEAILTTDTRKKILSIQVEIEGKTVTLTGIAKGSGMIKPNMATMLAYIASDVKIEQRLLEKLLADITDQSFNCITIDGDTSTNDAFVCMTTGKSGVEIKSNTEGFKAFYEALKILSIFLAQEIIRDGEGATKFIEVSVEQGVDTGECKEVAYTIAHSPLVKTAFFASDPNWGRILAALGRAPVQGNALDISQVDIYLGSTLLISKGELAESYTEEKGQKEMDEKDIQVRVLLNRGDAEAKVWTCDFSYDYVKINAEYRS